jgi:YuzL-like protein
MEAPQKVNGALEANAVLWAGNPRLILIGRQEVSRMKHKKNPSKAGVSAASVKGDAGPTVERDGGGKRNSQNNQYKK